MEGDWWKRGSKVGWGRGLGGHLGGRGQWREVGAGEGMAWGDSKVGWPEGREQLRVLVWALGCSGGRVSRAGCWVTDPSRPETPSRGSNTPAWARARPAALPCGELGGRALRPGRCNLLLLQLGIVVISLGTPGCMHHVAEALGTCPKLGHWLVLNNCHRQERWPPAVLAQLSKLQRAPEGEGPSPPPPRDPKCCPTPASPCAWLLLGVACLPAPPWQLPLQPPPRLPHPPPVSRLPPLHVLPTPQLRHEDFCAFVSYCRGGEGP